MLMRFSPSENLLTVVNLPGGRNPALIVPVKAADVHEAISCRLKIV